MQDIPNYLEPDQSGSNRIAANRRQPHTLYLQAASGCIGGQLHDSRPHLHRITNSQRARISLWSLSSNFCGVRSVSGLPHGSYIHKLFQHHLERCPSVLASGSLLASSASHSSTAQYHPAFLHLNWIYSGISTLPYPKKSQGHSS